MIFTLCILAKKVNNKTYKEIINKNFLNSNEYACHTNKLNHFTFKLHEISFSPSVGHLFTQAYENKNFTITIVSSTSIKK